MCKSWSQVHTVDQTVHPPNKHSFVSQHLLVGRCPLLKKSIQKTKNEVEPLGTGVDTHTVPLCVARAKDLNRYLKSLRNKRKKHRKSSAKRAREKGRSRKKVNT